MNPLFSTDQISIKTTFLLVKLLYLLHNFLLVNVQVEVHVYSFHFNFKSVISHLFRNQFRILNRSKIDHEK